MVLTPKENAEELIESMNIPYKYGEYFTMSFYQRKQCALVAINVIIKESENVTSIRYWLEVKQEIDKL